jgi:anthranilate synthase/aminodeoxychorismate synthase-like glutamine amidotransferase
MIDNYDSFTYNLYQYFGILGANVDVVRNDKIEASEVNIKKYNKIVISPGPGTPADSGVSKDIVLRFKGKLPILGVCLGHQTIGEIFGSVVRRADRVMHGKTSEISHNGDVIFKDVPSPFVATRYHSLVIDKETLGKELEITALSDDNEIMAIKHKRFPVWGIQFHPESILTKYGLKILRNFLEL